MKLDKNRIVRTLIQSASGAGIALITAISQDWSEQSIITAVISFATTVAISVLMNIKSQAEEAEDYE